MVTGMADRDERRQQRREQTDQARSQINDWLASTRGAGIMLVLFALIILAFVLNLFHI